MIFFKFLNFFLYIFLNSTVSLCSTFHPLPPFLFHFNFHINFFLLHFRLSLLFFSSCPRFQGQYSLSFSKFFFSSFGVFFFYCFNHFFFPLLMVLFVIVDLIVTSHLFFFLVNLYYFYAYLVSLVLIFYSDQFRC